MINRIIMRLVAAISKLLGLFSRTGSALPRQPLVELFCIQDGVYCGGIHMHKDTDWELHPDGDETLTLLSGRIDLVLEADGQERVIALYPGTSGIVPAGIWHRQVVIEPGKLLFMTPGDTTQHRKLVS